MAVVVMPLAIDLFCGLGGWTSGLLAESYDVVGFDIERHAYGEHRYPARLVIQDVLTLHGSQFRSADLIVAETNFGGAMVGEIIRSANIKVDD